MANRGNRVGPAATACLLLGVVAAGGWALAQATEGVLRDGFESDRTAWKIEKTDSEVRLFAHDRSRRVAREGEASEHFQFEAGPGGDGFYVSYGLPKVPAAEPGRVGLQVRSDRAGVQLLGRVILPGDVDPETNQPSFVMVPGTSVEAPGRWQRLELRDLPRAVEQQARVLRVATKRKVSLEGAYLDRLVVNLDGGPGPTEVYLDDLRVEPVPAATAEAFARTTRAREAGDLPPLPGPRGRAVSATGDAAPPADEAPAKAAAAGIAMERNLLTRDGRPWLPTIVRTRDADPVKIRRAGFDILAIPAGDEAEAIKEAAATGLFLMPEIDPGRDGAGLDPNRIRQLVEQFPAVKSVAFWSLGRDLGGTISLEARKRERQRVADATHALRAFKDFSGLSTGEVVGFFPQYARVPDQLDLIGARPFGTGTTQEVDEAFKYLEQRRHLTALENADAPIIAWLEMVPDRAFTRAIWGLDRPPSWGVPRVHPDQLRQSAYVALSAGCRGLGFDANIDLTKGSGRALLIEAALLNEEVDLIEWLLADTAKSAQIVPTYRPDLVITPASQGISAMSSKANRKPETPPHESVYAATFGTKDRRGVLLLVADRAPFSQFQPPKMGVKDLNIDVPGLPDEAIAYAISPGDVAVIPSKRTPGGIKIEVPEFGGTAIVYVTTDGARIAEIQRAVARVRPKAVALLIEQVQLLFASTLEVHRLLLDDGHKIPDTNIDEILSKATTCLKSAQDAQEALDYSLAWSEALGARRELTHLMRLHWETALAEFTKLLTDPKGPAGPAPLAGFQGTPIRFFSVVSVPPLTSFATLPQAYVWKDWIAKGRLSQNLLPSGNFENPEGLARAGWLDEGYESEKTHAEFVIMPEKAPNNQVRRVLKLSGSPADAKAGVDALAPYLDHPVAAVRTPPVKVYEGELIRIAVQIDMPTMTVPGAGGVIVRDSIGGDPLQFRSSAAVPGWQEVVLFRRAPADGELTVLLGYGGHQFARFDNFRIQKVISAPQDDRPVAAVPAPLPARRR